VVPHPYQWDPFHPASTHWGLTAQYDYHTFTLQFAPPDGILPPPGTLLQLNVVMSTPRDLVPGEALLAPPFTFTIALPPAVP
jgi:hypothetical protein